MKTMLGYDSSFFLSLGLNFFDSYPMINKFFQPIQEVYQKHYINQDKVLFTGINIGGIIAQILGMENNRSSVSFFWLFSIFEYNFSFF